MPGYVLTFAEAAAFVLPWGKYKGMALDKIAETDEGLRYLDWLYGERGCNPKTVQYSTIDAALIAYLNDPTIAKDVAKLTKKD